MNKKLSAEDMVMGIPKAALKADDDRAQQIRIGYQLAMIQAGRQKLAEEKQQASQEVADLMSRAQMMNQQAMQAQQMQQQAQNPFQGQTPNPYLAGQPDPMAGGAMPPGPEMGGPPPMAFGM